MSAALTQPTGCDLSRVAVRGPGPGEQAARAEVWGCTWPPAGVVSAQPQGARGNWLAGQVATAASVLLSASISITRSAVCKRQIFFPRGGRAKQPLGGGRGGSQGRALSPTPPASRGSGRARLGDITPADAAYVGSMQMSFLVSCSLHPLFIFQLGLRQREDVPWLCHVVLNKHSICKSQAAQSSLSPERDFRERLA